MLPIWYCDHDHRVIPHKTKRDPDDLDKWVTVLWRVPKRCPRPDSEVVKSNQKANFSRRMVSRYDQNAVIDENIVSVPFNFETDGAL